MPPIRVGLIGYGYWGPNLARNIRESERYELVVLAEASEERRALARRRLGVDTVYFSGDDWLYQERGGRGLDAIVIATPPGSHFDLVSAALADARCHVLVTKPLATGLEEAKELAELARAHDRVLLVDHTFVYTGAVQKLNELFVSGWLGDFHYVDSVRINLGGFQRGTNVLWDLASHDLSILDYLSGGPLPDGVAAVAADPLNCGQASIAHLHLWYGGTLVHVHVNWHSPVKARRMIFGGSRRLAVYDEGEPSEKVRVYDAGADLVDPADIRAALVDYRRGDCLIPKLDNREALAGLLDHFADCIEFNDLPLTGADQGVRVVRILEAAERSLAEGGCRVPVELPA